MKKFITVLAVILLFVCAAAVVQPRSHAITQDVQEFQNDYIAPTMTVSATYYEPTRKAIFNYTCKVTFPPLTPLKDNALSAEYQQGAHHVTEFINEQPSDFICDYNNMQLQKIEHWANGSITYTPLDKSLQQNERESGLRYEGWFPSPNQLCDYIAWSNGWELQYVYAASHDYEAKGGNTIPDIIYEQTVPNCGVIHNYNDPEITITQQAMAKMPGSLPSFDASQFPRETLSCNITPIAFQTSNTSKSPIPPSWIPVASACVWLAVIIVVAIIILSICNAWVQTDTTPYGLKDLEAAYKKGYGNARNESYADWDQRLKDLLRTGKISNETYWLLNGQNRGVYNDLGAKYVNPYDLKPQGGANDWIHTIIEIIQIAVIVAICIAVGYIIIWALRFLKGSGKHREGGTTNVFPSSIRQARQITDTLKQLFLQGLSTGSIA